MSLHLEKIHYWLFDKVKWFQGLEERIINLVKEEGIIIEEYLEAITTQYGERLPNLPLEEIIDKGNIHGWLQGKINSAEGRVAAWSKIALSCSEGKLKLENIFISEGMKAGEEVINSGEELNSAVEIYNSLNDNIFHGMPFDKADEIITSTELKIHWKKSEGVHKKIWEKAGVDVSLFYELRALWIKAFVTEVNSNFHFADLKDGTMIIENSMSSENMQVYELDI